MKGGYRLKTIGVAMLALSFTTASFAGVVLDGSADGSGTHSPVAVINSTYEITQGMGSTSANGTNLFHSFDSFTVEEGLTANFSGADTINNIIGRVTGSSASRIDGTLSSSIIGVNLYLLNPNGIMFGATASINITGSFYASTANTLTDTNGEKLSSHINDGLTLFSADPSDFGFTTGTPAAIDVIGSTLSVNDGQTLSLIGGNITLDNGARLQASDGTINIASAASSGAVTISPDTIEMNGFTSLGDITLSNTLDVARSTEITTSGGSAGHIVIRGGTLTLNGGSKISANSGGSGSNNYSENIDIVAATAISLNNQSSITNDIGIFASADTKGIRLTAESISVDTESSITANTSILSSGDSGDIEINAQQLNLTNQAYVATEGGESGKVGNITINAQEVLMQDGGYVGSASYGDGDTGNITINSDNITINGPETSAAPFVDDFTGVYTEKNLADSLGGDITINNTRNLKLDSRGAIVTDNYGATVGGDIRINSRSINVLRGSILGASAEDSGNGGNVYISSNDLNVIGAHEDYRTSFTGTPIFDVSSIFTSGPLAPLTTGDTGNININSENVNVLDGALIATLSTFSTGKTGSISIEASNIRVSGINAFMKNVYLNETSFSEEIVNRLSSSKLKNSTALTPIFGDILPTSIGSFSVVANNLILDSGGHINTETQGIADSSDISLNVDNLQISGGSYITSASTNGQGKAGNITVHSDNITIDGEEDQLLKSGFYTDTNEFGNGTGGNIKINTSSLRMANNTIISSESNGNGNGGDISIDSTEYTILSNGAQISTKASETSNGHAGDIDINTGLFVLNNGNITTTAITGNGGDINITAREIIITQDSVIDAASEQSVSGAINISTDIDITASILRLTDKSTDESHKFRDECSYNALEDSSFLVAGSFSPSFSGNFSTNSVYALHTPDTVNYVYKATGGNAQPMGSNANKYGEVMSKEMLGCSKSTR